MKTETRQRLRGLIAKIERGLVGLSDEGPWRPRDKAATQILANLARHDGARYRDTRANGAHHVLRLAGVATSSTSSRYGCLRNWCAAARRRLDKDRAA